MTNTPEERGGRPRARAEDAGGAGPRGADAAADGGVTGGDGPCRAAGGTGVVADDGARLWAVRETDGPAAPVILCHGGPGIWDTLREPAALLGARPVVRWDQRGCGRSQRTGPYTVARSVADLEAVRRTFGLERTALVGHSWGAQLALLHALEHPERVSALVYVSGVGVDDESTWHPAYAAAHRERLGPRLGRWTALRDRRGDGLTRAEERELAVLQWSADFLGPDALAAAEAMATPWFGVNQACNRALGREMRQLVAGGCLRERCAALAVPVLILDGARDIRPRSAVDSLERALPHVTRAVLPEAGHMPWAEDPAGFASALTAFLDG
ncbi:alpha/beta fold hydrolase [Streptomyces fuscigenes]|uniref:alpha/beta fold hydrolase n=1 Tax=Streptomyces fuscigenes TaxID=1528880 RepID=UPI001F48A9AD|nr:alpha/beta hydrolase [Streptomyces fuscigenes]MCF3964124.1 alpha/beta hydrolase [Streptomyces fuscigenes]